MGKAFSSAALLALAVAALAADDPPKKAAPAGKMVYTVKNADFPMKGVVVTVHNTPAGKHEIRIENTDKSELIFSNLPDGGGSLTVSHIEGRIESVTLGKRKIPFAKTAPPEAKPIKVEKKEKPKPKVDNEAKATSYLVFAKKLLEKGMAEKAKVRLEEIVKDFPETKAAAEAKELLEKMKK